MAGPISDLGKVTLDQSVSSVGHTGSLQLLALKEIELIQQRIRNQSSIALFRGEFVTVADNERVALVSSIADLSSNQITADVYFSASL